MTSRHSSPALVAALRGALIDLASDNAYEPVFAALLLAGIELCDANAYDVIIDYERDAERLGYALLA